MDFLTNEQLDQKVPEWQEQLKLPPQKGLDFHSPALLVLDMQNDFLEEKGQMPVWGGRAVIPNISELLKTCSSKDIPIFFTRHICLQPYKHMNEIAAMKHVSNPEEFLQDNSWGSKIHGKLEQYSDSQVIKKYKYSAFYNTSLEVLLRAQSVKEVIVTGVATNLCCETTAHDAFFREFQVYFPLDANGGTDEGQHIASVKNVNMSYGSVPRTRCVLESLEEF